MGGVVQGVPMIRRVHVHHPERPADHGRRGLVYRQSARHVGREADPEQPVVPGVPVDAGAELDPSGVLPQHRLLGDLQPVQRERGHQPRADRAPFLPHGRRDRHGTKPRALGGQVPGTLAMPGVLRVLVLDHQLVAGPGQHAGAGALVEHAHRPAARRIGGDHVAPVLDGVPGRERVLAPLAGPLARRFGRYQPVGPEPERGHVGDEHGEGDLGQRSVRPAPDPFGQCAHRLTGGVPDLQPPRGVVWHLHRDPRHSVPGARQPVEHRHRPERRPPRTPLGQVGGGVAAGRRAEFPGLAPAAQQVQVHLVGLDPGDAVVVGAEGQQPPGLVQRRVRVGRARPARPGCRAVRPR